MITDGSWTPKVHTQALVDDTRNSGKIEEICGLYSQVILERVMEKSEIQFLAY